MSFFVSGFKEFHLDAPEYTILRLYASRFGVFMINFFEDFDLVWILLS